MSKKVNSEVSLNIIEIRKPELDAKLVADGIAQQLERRVAFRNYEAVQNAIRLGAEGVRINCAGGSVVLKLLELNGTEKEEFHYTL